MTDEQKPKHAFARSLSNAGLCAFLAEIKKLFARKHLHKWEESGRNKWCVTVEQRCSCGEYRHHLFRDIGALGDDPKWRKGKHPWGA